MKHRRPGLHAGFAPLIWGALALLLPTDAARAGFGIDAHLSTLGEGSFTCRNGAHGLAADCEGNVHAIYGTFFIEHEFDQEVEPVYRMYDRSLETWLPEERIPGVDRTVCWWNTAIAADCHGNAHAVWFDLCCGEEPSLFYRMRAADGTWGVRETAGPVVPSSAETPAVAVDRMGNVWVVWAQAQANPLGGVLYNIQLRVRDVNTGAWDLVQTLTPYLPGVHPSPGAASPTIALQHWKGSDNVVAHVAWWDGGLEQVGYTWLRRIHDGGYFDAVGPTTLLSGIPGSPSIGVQCDSLHIVWSGWSDEILQHRVGALSGFPGAVTFAPPVATEVTATQPNLCMDGMGNAHVVYKGPFGITHAEWNHATRSWAVTGALSETGGGEWPQVAVDDQAGIHVTWTDSDMSENYVAYDHGLCPGEPPGRSLTPVTEARLDGSLRGAMAASASGEKIPVILRMREQVDPVSLEASVSGLSTLERRRQAVTHLRTFSDQAQQNIRQELARAEAAGEAEKIRPLWLVNAVAAHLTASEIQRLAARADVAAVIHDPRRPVLEGSAAQMGNPREVEKAPNGSVAQIGSVVQKQSVSQRKSTAPIAQPREVELTPKLAPPPSPPLALDVAWGVTYINAPEVWDEGYKGQCILVAVLDSGVDLDHPDLEHRLWVNPGEIPGNLADDGDDNLLVDDVHGYDFGDDDGDPEDVMGHGTHVAGTICGDGTGGTITGVAPEASLLVVKVIADDGESSPSIIVQGIEYAIASGAQVLNLSLGWWCPTATQREIFRMESDRVKVIGVTMCIAGGNEGCAGGGPNQVEPPGDSPPPWRSPDQPALGASSGATTVGATDYKMEDIAPFSARGPVDWSETEFGDWSLCDPAVQGVGLIKPDVSAPGMRILSTQMGGGYVGEMGLPSTWRWGTSMATPHVTGLAALMLSKNHELLNADIHRILEETAIDLGPPGKDNRWGAGRVSAFGAVDAVPTQTTPSISLISVAWYDTVGAANGNGLLEAGEEADLVLTLRNNGPYLLGNLRASLSADETITFEEYIGIFGDFIVNETKDNADNPYRILVLPDAPDGHVVTFDVDITAYGACATASFTATLHQIPCGHVFTHDDGNVRFSVTDQGISGFLDGTHAGGGSGFVFPQATGPNRLYIGGPWAAAGPDYVLNREYDADPVKDWIYETCIQPSGAEDPIVADQKTVAAFDDAGHPAPRDLLIVQRSYSWATAPDDDYVIVSYEAVNRGTTPLEDLWLGQFMDWDLDDASSSIHNRGKTDPARDLVYMWRVDDADSSYVGVRLLSHPGEGQMSLIRNATYVWPQAYLLDADRYQFLRGDPGYVVTNTPAADDWSTISSMGPFTLAPGDTTRVAFAILGGATRADLLANADAARTRWIQEWAVSVPENEGAPTRLLLASASPNPFRDRTTLRWSLPFAGSAEVSVYDVLGREVARLAAGPFEAGTHVTAWDGRNEAGSSLPGGTYYARLRAGGRETSIKLSLTR